MQQLEQRKLLKLGPGPTLPTPMFRDLELRPFKVILIHRATVN